MNKLFLQSANRGYTLLFAVLTASIVLGVAVFILSVSTKQFELSASTRNSIYSFYAADAGIECAAGAYLGLNGGNISSSTGATVRCGTTTSTTPQQKVVGPFVLASPGYPPFLVNTGATRVYQTPSNLNFIFTNGTCAVITMYDGFDAQGFHYMIIDSRGYNKCTSAGTPDITSPSTVERALRLTKKG